MQVSSGFRSNCPIVSLLDVVGDKWSLVVIRNMMLGARSYGDFHKAPEKIATNILAERLERLTRFGLIEEAPARSGARGGYRLTAAGADLLPVLQAMATWGEVHLPDRWSAPEWFMAATPSELLERAATT